MHTYETLFIVNPDLDESEINKAIEAVQDVITAGGGKILKVDIWGRRQLAYMIQKKTDGFYVLIYFEAPATLKCGFPYAWQPIERSVRVPVSLRRHHRDCLPQQAK